MSLRNLTAVKEALTSGADINCTTDGGDTPLAWAEREDHLETIQFLIDHGAEFDSLDTYYGETILHKAISHNHIEVVKLLLANGADANAKNKYGKTVLYDAIKNGSVKIVELLLDHGVDVNSIVSEEKKLTPLLLVVIQRQKEIVKLLLSRGADRKAVDIDGNTVYNWAIYDPAIGQLLR